MFSFSFGFSFVIFAFLHYISTKVTAKYSWCVPFKELSRLIISTHIF